MIVLDLSATPLFYYAPGDWLLYKKKWHRIVRVCAREVHLEKLSWWERFRDK